MTMTGLRLSIDKNTKQQRKKVFWENCTNNYKDIVVVVQDLIPLKDFVFKFNQMNNPSLAVL